LGVKVRKFIGLQEAEKLLVYWWDVESQALGYATQFQMGKYFSAPFGLSDGGEQRDIIIDSILD
jgi:hypothetical protein